MYNCMISNYFDQYQYIHVVALVLKTEPLLNLIKMTLSLKFALIEGCDFNKIEPKIDLCMFKRSPTYCTARQFDRRLELYFIENSIVYIIVVICRTKLNLFRSYNVLSYVRQERLIKLNMYEYMCFGQFMASIQCLNHWMLSDKCKS